MSHDDATDIVLAVECDCHVDFFSKDDEDDGHDVETKEKAPAQVVETSRRTAVPRTRPMADR